jgi:adenylylsulfate kinase-like enzyme
MELERRLFDLGAIAMVLDGEREVGLESGIGLQPGGRAEHLRRVAEVARLLNDAGQIVICATISPYRSDRKQAAEIIGTDRFLEVYLDAATSVVRKNDQTGLYLRAREGAIEHLAGVHVPYEPPENPAVRILPNETSTSDEASLVLGALRAKGFLTRDLESPSE